MTHHCHAEGCNVAVPPRMMMCKRHWYLVPRWLRDKVWEVYRPGQELDKRPSHRYVLVQIYCRILVAEREGVNAENAWRQLKLLLGDLPSVQEGQLTRGEVKAILERVIRNPHQQNLFG